MCQAFLVFFLFFLFSYLLFWAGIQVFVLVRSWVWAGPGLSVGLDAEPRTCTISTQAYMKYIHAYIPTHIDVYNRTDSL